MLSRIQYCAQVVRLQICLNKAVEKIGNKETDIKRIKEEAVRLYNTSHKSQPLDFTTKQEVFNNYFQK